MRTLSALIAVALLVLQIRMWLGEGSIAEVVSLQRSVAEQKMENDRLKTRNEALSADVEDLKGGLAAVEERARRELGMIGQDEVFYQVIDE